MTDFNNSRSFWDDELSKVEDFLQSRLPHEESVVSKKERLNMAIQLLILDRLDTIAQRLDR